MSFVHLLNFLAPLEIAAVLTSAIVWLLLRFFGENLKKFTPIAQFRLVFTAAVLPVLVGATFFIAATFGWAVQGETDLCLARAKSGHLSSFLIVFSIIFIGALIFRLTRLANKLRKEHQFRKLLAKSAVRRFGIFRLVPMHEPQAFVFGFIKPKIYLSSGLLKKFDKNSLKTVIAHEKAHVARRDPLRRLLALFALVFHLPPVASEINQQLALIQELIADNAAAEKSGSRLNLAQLLIDFARLNLAGNAVGNISAFEFVNSNVEIRVRRLLDSDHKSAKVSLAAFAVAGFAIFFGVFVMSPKLHLLYEIILSIY